MHLSMGIQKAIFKFIIRWAADLRLGSALQRRLADLLTAVQDLKLAYCPCRPYKNEKFGGFTAETYRSMCMISCQLYHCLLEHDLAPPAPRGPNPKPQSEWIKEDNCNWMYLRDIEFASGITAPEAKQQLQTAMKSRTRYPIVNSPRVFITTNQIRDLIWRMFNMFRSIFCNDLFGVQAKNRATASVMRFLSHLETLDLMLNPKR